MSHAIAPVQQATPEAATPPAAAVPKANPTGAANAAPQDKVTISEASKQALANSAKPTAGG